jgi:hypothetical protein
MATKPKQLEDWESRRRPQFCWDCVAFDRETGVCAEFGPVPEEAQNTPDMCLAWDMEVPF